MDASYFIAGRLRFKGKIATACIAVSFLVMIIAVSVSGGFRYEIRQGLADLTGDIRITPPNRNVMDEGSPIEAVPAYLSYVKEVSGVDRIVPTVYRAGIIRHDGNIHGVLFKGVPVDEFPSEVADTIPLAVSIPSRLARISGLSEGDVIEMDYGYSVRWHFFIQLIERRIEDTKYEIPKVLDGKGFGIVEDVSIDVVGNLLSQRTLYDGIDYTKFVNDEERYSDHFKMLKLIYENMKE